MFLASARCPGLLPCASTADAVTAHANATAEIHAFRNFIFLPCSFLLTEVGELARGTGQLNDVHTGIIAVHHINVAAIIYFDGVGHDRSLAEFFAVKLHAARDRLPGRRRDIEADLLQVKRISHVHRAHTGIEPRDEHDALVVDRRQVRLRRVGTEAGAAGAEISALLGHLEVRDPERLGLVGDIHDKQHLALFAAFVFDRFRHDEYEIANPAPGVPGELRNLHAE